jgi:hypothetical protein
MNTINWRVTPINLEPNGLATIEILSAPLRDAVHVTISTPNNSMYTVDITITEGKGEAQVMLNSGEGEYEFTLVDALPTVLRVYATSQAAPALTCKLTTTVARLTYLQGQEFKIIVSQGLSGLATVICHHTLIPVTLDENGNGVAYYSHPVAGDINILAIQGTCSASAKVVNILPSINLPNTIANPLPKCQHPLRVTCKISRPTIPTGETATLTITVCNENNSALSYTLPAVTFAPDLGISSSTTIAINNESIPPTTCRDFNFTIQGTNATNTYKTATIVLPHHTYVCEGESYTVAASGVSTIITPASQTCGLEVTHFSLSSTYVPKGTKVQLRMDIVNRGSGNISKLTLLPINLPSALGGGVFSFDNVSIDAGSNFINIQEYTTSNTTQYPITAVVYIPANSITGLCSGTLLADNEPHTVSVTVGA